MTKAHPRIIGQIAFDFKQTYIRANCIPSKIHPGCWEDKELCEAQCYLDRAGIKGAEIIETFYGYSLRYASGLDNWGIIERSIPSLETAIEIAERWVASNPSKLYVTISESIL